MKRLTAEALEDEYDARIGESAYQEYLNDLKAGYEPMSWEDMLAELDENNQ